jgi:hypothetical protein
MTSRNHTGPDWSPEAQQQALLRDVMASGGESLEIRRNQNLMENAQNAGERTQKLRDVNGQAMTQEESYRRRLMMQGQQDRKESMDYRSRENAADRQSEELIAELENQPPQLARHDMGDLGSVLTYGSTQPQVLRPTSEGGSVEQIGDGVWIERDRDGNPKLRFAPGQDVDPMIRLAASGLAAELQSDELSPKERKQKQARLDLLLGNLGGGGQNVRQASGGVAASREAAAPGQQYRAPDGSIRTKAGQ